MKKVEEFTKEIRGFELEREISEEAAEAVAGGVLPIAETMGTLAGILGKHDQDFQESLNDPKFSDYLPSEIQK